MRGHPYNPGMTLPDRGHLPTEQRHAGSTALDAGDAGHSLRTLHACTAGVHEAVGQALPELERFAAALVGRMRLGGRLMYLGAGTSGRLAVLDASECPPTFRSAPDQVVGVIAGGDGALRVSSEGKEDEYTGAHPALAALNLAANDTVVGVAAGGTTPYPWGALDYARRHGCLTAFLCCVPRAALERSRAPVELADHLICIPSGPEPVTGSTRMNAGTATKLALNLVSTTAMVQLGKVWGNLMVDLKASNDKLRDRAGRLVAAQVGCERDRALALLDAAGGSAKLALVMGRLGLSRAEAEAKLAAAGGLLRPLLGEPRP